MSRSPRHRAFPCAGQNGSESAHPGATRVPSRRSAPGIGPPRIASTPHRTDHAEERRHAPAGRMIDPPPPAGDARQPITNSVRPIRSPRPHHPQQASEPVRLRKRRRKLHRRARLHHRPQRSRKRHPAQIEQVRQHTTNPKLRRDRHPRRRQRHHQVRHHRRQKPLLRRPRPRVILARPSRRQAHHVRHDHHLPEARAGSRSLRSPSRSPLSRLASGHRCAPRPPLRPVSARPAAVAMTHLLTKTTEPETIRTVDATNRLSLSAHQRLDLNAERDRASSA